MAFSISRKNGDSFPVIDEIGLEEETFPQTIEPYNEAGDVPRQLDVNALRFNEMTMPMFGKESKTGDLYFQPNSFAEETVSSIIAETGEKVQVKNWVAVKPKENIKQYFYLLATTVRFSQRNQSVSSIADKLLDIFQKEFICDVVKARPVKGSLKMRFVVNSASVLVKIRFYDWEGDYAIEFQKQCGGSVQFHVVFNKARELLIARCNATYELSKVLDDYADSLAFPPMHYEEDVVRNANFVFCNSSQDSSDDSQNSCFSVIDEFKASLPVHPPSEEDWESMMVHAKDQIDSNTNVAETVANMAEYAKDYEASELGPLANVLSGKFVSDCLLLAPCKYAMSTIIHRLAGDIDCAVQILCKLEPCGFLTSVFGCDDVVKQECLGDNFSEKQLHRPSSMANRELSMAILDLVSITSSFGLDKNVAEQWLDELMNISRVLERYHGDKDVALRNLKSAEKQLLSAI